VKSVGACLKSLLIAQSVFLLRLLQPSMIPLELQWVAEELMQLKVPVRRLWILIPSHYSSTPSLASRFTTIETSPLHSLLPQAADAALASADQQVMAPPHVRKSCSASVV
jgi:hypothetical protein